MKYFKWLLVAFASLAATIVTTTSHAAVQVHADPNRILVKNEAQLTDPRIARELACLTKNIFYEAGAEPFEGKVAVANVTINRVQDTRYPKTICGVVQEKTVVNRKVVCQFSWVCERPFTMSTVNDKYKEASRVAKLVLLKGYHIPRLDNSFNFHATSVSPNWRKPQVAKIGNHVFYSDRNKDKTRRNAMPF